MAVVGNTVMRVMADTQAGLARLILKYADWLALQLMADTAEKIWLDRHGSIWLVNADGSTGRKNPTLATGTVQITGVPGIVVPEGTVLVSPTGESYETLAFITLTDQPTEVAVRALASGADSNQFPDTPLAMDTPQAGVDEITVLDLRSGLDMETDEQLRARVLARIRQPPMGGCAYDFEQWMFRIPAITRVWVAPREMGMGTVTVRFMMDGVHEATGGFPAPDDVTIMRNYLDTLRPVAVRDFFVESPVPEPIDFNLSLVNDSLAMRDQVAGSVIAMLYEKAKPAHQIGGELVGGTTILASWIAEAINRVTDDFTLVMDDHPMPHNGALAVLGTISYPVP